MTKLPLGRLRIEVKLKGQLGHLAGVLFYLDDLRIC